MSLNKKIMLAIVFGIVLGATFTGLFQASSISETPIRHAVQKKPLYWVAPMDSNYRRDKPGKSPMGMDLIAVYENNDSADDYGRGTVKIAPHVINNLGVRTGQVKRRVLETRISTVGYIKYDEDKMVHIHPRVDGWIEQLFVKAVGDPVSKGQALYTLYSPQLVNAQKELLIALNRGNTALIVAAKERLQALQLSEQFIQQLQTTKIVQQTVTFNAPQSGVVDALNIREGYFVKPGKTLMSIAQLSQVWVEAEVFERDSALIKSGLPVSMTLEYLPGQLWKGKVDYVYPSLNSKTRTLRVRLKFDNPDSLLKPNMFAQVVIFADKSEDALSIPKQALIRTGQQNRVVLAYGEGHFKSVEVNIGRIENDYIEILSGLNEGDLIVISAQFLIDSESSKQSDFQRMNSNLQPESIVWSATVNGIVNQLDINNRVLNISRDPIEKWGRPAATMDFIATSDIDLTLLRQGSAVRFTFEVRDDLLITKLSSQHEQIQ